MRTKSGVTAPAGWAATGTGAMALANASDLGALDRGKSVEVVLGLQMRNVDAVKSAIAAGQKMSRDAFVSQFAPSSDQVSAAVSYLRAQGFGNVSAAPNRMLVSATASAATVEKAFNTSLHAFSVERQELFREHAAGVRAGRARRQRRRGARPDELRRVCARRRSRGLPPA